MKKALKITGIFLAAVILVIALALGLLTSMEYQPAQQQAAERTALVQGGSPAGRNLSICTWNIGYGGLGKESDFFMDGGEMVNPPSRQILDQNLAAITGFMSEHPADAWFVQEVDENASRTGGIDQFDLLQSALGTSGAYTYNYNCPFVPFPVPPIGKVQSGLATFTSLDMDQNALRIALHCPFTWPVRIANMKRCLLLTRIPVEGTDKDLVLVNLHLEAYESGEGRIAQTRELMTLLESEYAKGNYVIAGGDFNQNFPGALDVFPMDESAAWKPGLLESDSLPEGWRYAADLSHATCRLLDAPYSADTQLYVIDGFILSPNVELTSIETIPLDFEHSDHNPVFMQVNLL